MVAALGLAAPTQLGAGVALQLSDAGGLWGAWPAVGQSVYTQGITPTALAAISTTTPFNVYSFGAAPTAGLKIGVFWPVTGFVYTTIQAVGAPTGSLYPITISGWSKQPTAAEAALTANDPGIIAWHPDLPAVGAAIQAYFGTLGPDNSTVPRIPVLAAISPVSGLPDAPFAPSLGTLAANTQNAGRFVQSIASLSYTSTTQWPPQILYPAGVSIVRAN
jgi:hypothetical protein